MATRDRASSTFGPGVRWLPGQRGKLTIARYLNWVPSGANGLEHEV